MPNALPSNNLLVNVPTYQKSDLGPLYICNPLIYTANKKFDNFQTFIGQKGSTVNFDKPLQLVGTPSLVAQFEAVIQRLQSLSVNQEFSVAISGSAQQFIFNLNDYMDRIGLSAVRRIGAAVSENVAKLALTNTYRCYGDGRTPINSPGQLAQALEGMRDYGDPGFPTRGYLPNTFVPPIVNSMLNQFVPNRNEEISNSWLIGDYEQCSWYRVTNMPKQICGAFGNIDPVTLNLTISAISNSQNSDGTYSTQITMTSTGGTETVALRANDILTLDASGAKNAFFLQFMAYNVTQQKIQVQVLQDASSSGGTVTVNVYPGLVSQVDNPLAPQQNINVPLQSLVGAYVTTTASHQAGLVVGGNALYIAMPRLPSMEPFPSGNEMDDETGVSMRVYYSVIPGQNIQGLVHDIIWGSTLIPEYAFRIAFPLNP
jgi:P22 coat protein - gene protein 5